MDDDGLVAGALLPLLDQLQQFNERLLAQRQRLLRRPAVELELTHVSRLGALQVWDKQNNDARLAARTYSQRIMITCTNTPSTVHTHTRLR